VGQPELLAEPADLVLEQVAQRLHELETEPLGQPAHVVVGLDDGRRPPHARGLDDVGVERPLGEGAGIREAPRLGLEDLDELAADDPALLLGSATPRAPTGSVGGSRGRASPGPEPRHHLSGSSWRSSPVSTKIGTRRSPIASRSNMAVTVESTPPEIPQITRPTGSNARRPATDS
jgi:hypothetical protein